MILCWNTSAQLLPYILIILLYLNIQISSSNQEFINTKPC